MEYRFVKSTQTVAVDLENDAMLIKGKGGIDVYDADGEVIDTFSPGDVFVREYVKLEKEFCLKYGVYIEKITEKFRENREFLDKRED